MGEKGKKKSSKVKRLKGQSVTRSKNKKFLKMVLKKVKRVEKVKKW